MPGQLARSLALFLFIFALVLTTGISIAVAQTPDNVANLELLQLIHTPNAGVLKKGQYLVDLHAYGNGGLNMGIGIGLFDRMMFGVSYGGNSLLGYEKPVWNDLPGMVFKYRFIEEDNVFPAITVGFDMQGKGAWFDGVDRYQFKAPGLFAAASRNFISEFGRFGIHGGANYNTIENENDSGLDFFCGADMSLSEQLILIGEYDFALDDNKEDQRFGEGPYGYLNLGVRLVFAQSLVIEVDATDLLNTSTITPGIGREIKIMYLETFSF